MAALANQVLDLQSAQGEAIVERLNAPYDGGAELCHSRVSLKLREQRGFRCGTEVAAGSQGL